MKYGGFIFEEEEREAIERVLKRNWWLLGEDTDMFEKELAEVAQTEDAIFVNSGSSALLLAFDSLPKSDKKEVIVPATIFPTAITAIKKAGLKPVVVDSREETLCINEDEVEKAVNENTLAILSVHVAGYIPDIDRLKKHNCYLVIDNCDGFGGKWKDKPVESYGDIAVTSFHVAHVISTGQGGAVFCNKELGKKVRELRNWGRMESFDDDAEGVAPLPKDFQQRYTYTSWGYNLSPIEIQAALGREQLKKLDRFKKARDFNHNYLSERIDLEKPKTTEGSEPVYFTLPLLSDKRKDILKRFREKGIEYRNILAGNITLHPAFGNPQEMSGAKEITEKGFWVSVHPSLKLEEMDYIIKNI